MKYNQSRGNSLFDVMWQMHDDMDRIFGSPTGQLVNVYPKLEGNCGKGKSCSSYRNAISDLYETESDVIASVELPGVDKDKINVLVTDDAVEVKVEKGEEKKEEKKGSVSKARGFIGFYKRVPLPEYADRDKAEATYRNGILTVTLPKIEDIAPTRRQLEVK